MQLQYSISENFVRDMKALDHDAHFEKYKNLVVNAITNMSEKKAVTGFTDGSYLIRDENGNFCVLETIEVAKLILKTNLNDERSREFFPFEAH